MNPLNLCVSDPRSVRVGKVLTFARGCTLITSSTGAELQGGSYFVSNARVKGDTVTLSLNRAMQKPGGGFKISREAQQFRTTIAQLKAQYGFKIDRVSLMRGAIKEILKHEFKKAGKPEYLEELNHGDWDTAFKKVGNNLINKTMGATHVDESQRDDLIMDALERLLRPGTVVKNFNAEKNQLLPFLLSCFQRQMLTEIKYYKEEASNNVHNHTDYSHGESDSDDDLDEGSDGEEFDSPQKALEWKQLVKGLTTFIQKKKGAGRAKSLLTLMEGLLLGTSSVEIAEKLGVSKPAVSQMGVELRGLLVEFAKSTKDDDMLTLLKKWGVTSAVGEELESLGDALQRLKKIRKGGVKTTVCVSKLEDLDSDDALLDVVNSGSASAEELENLEAAFHANLAKFEDVIQGEDALIGLLRRK